MGTDIDVLGFGHRFRTDTPLHLFDDIAHTFNANIEVSERIESLQGYETVYKKDYGFQKYFRIDIPFCHYIENLPPDFDYQKIDWNAACIVDEINKSLKENLSYSLNGNEKNTPL